MNFSGKIKANQGPSNGPITGSIAMELDDGRRATIDFTLVNPEFDQVSIDFRRNGEPLADIHLGMEESELTAEQRAILQLLPQVLETSERAWSRNQAMREYGMIGRLERRVGVQVDVGAYCDFGSALSPDQAALVAPLFD